MGCKIEFMTHYKPPLLQNLRQLLLNSLHPKVPIYVYVKIALKSGSVACMQ